MTEKICYTCKYFELEGDAPFLIEHCILHNTYQKNLTEQLQVCADWESAQLKIGYEVKRMNKPWIGDDAGTLINMETRETYDYVSDLVDELNEKEETIQDLKTRNNRQYDLLKKITDLMYARDWDALEQMVVEWEEADRLLKAEFKCCNWGDV